MPTIVMELIRSRLTRQQRVWGSRALVGAIALPVLLSWVIRDRPIHYTPQIDRSSVRATFTSISAEGPQRQIVFHYALENTTGRPFATDRDACSTVSFRYPEIKPVGDGKKGGPTPPPQPNPALNLLESDASGGYTKATGLVRIPSKKHALGLDQCPLELQPRERKDVAIAIPYAYPAEDSGPSPSSEELKAYVGAFMPQIEGFGMADRDGHYQVEFPRAW